MENAGEAYKLRVAAACGAAERGRLSARERSAQNLTPAATAQ